MARGAFFFHADSRNFLLWRVKHFITGCPKISSLWRPNAFLLGDQQQPSCNNSFVARDTKIRLEVGYFFLLMIKNK